MKKLALLLIVLMTVGVFAGCAPAEPEQQPEPQPSEETQEPAQPAEETASFDVADGVYYAAEPVFGGSGWKYNVTVAVEGGKVVGADWNGTYVRGGEDKKTSSESGAYGMVAKGGAQAEWHEQAMAAEQYLIDNQTTEVNYTDDQGHTDAIAGVSIHVSEFFNLVDEALANGPVAKGAYTDGLYAAELPADDKGYTYMGQFQVVNGTIVAANYNAKSVDAEGNATSKKEMGDDYGMKAKGGAQAEWYEQAATIEAYVIANQGLNIEVNEDGKSDAVAGATIGMTQFVELFEMALGK